MTISYKPENVCAKEILFDVENNVITDVKFIGGCPGSAVGLGQLIKGMKVEEVIERLEGIPCRQRGTSCPDQLAKALREQLS
jgi:uncharacterized protein (TIGR03905 family)